MHPCDQMEAIRPGLQKELWGRGACCAAFWRRSNPPRRFHRKALLTLVRAWSSPQRRRIRRAILVFLHFFDGLLRRTIHSKPCARPSCPEQTAHPSDQRQRCAHEISGIYRSNFLRWPPRRLSSTFAKRGSPEPRWVMCGSLPRISSAKVDLSNPVDNGFPRRCAAHVFPAGRAG